MKKLKLFLSHASEDQVGFVRPLAEALLADFDVWYSEYELTMGDRLRVKIDQGLRSCDYGIVVLSPSFFAKRWPKEELDGLFSLETDEQKIILPIWKDVTEADVKGFSPMLSSRLGIDAGLGISRVVHEIKRSVGLVDRTKLIDAPAWKARFQKLDADTTHAARATQYLNTQEAIADFRRRGEEVLNLTVALANEMAAELSSLRFQIKRQANYVVIDGPKRIFLIIGMDIKYSNSLMDSVVTLRIGRDMRDFMDAGESKHEDLKRWTLAPSFDPNMHLLLGDGEHTFGDASALVGFALDEFSRTIEHEP